MSENKRKDYNMKKIKEEDERKRKKNDLYIGIITVTILVIIAFFIYLFTYKTPFDDPLAEIKNTFLKSQGISIVLTIILSAMAIISSKNKEKVIQKLVIVAMLTLVMIIGHFVVKLYLDRKYNADVFGEFYETYVERKSNHKKISFGTDGMKILNEKQAYIKDSMTAYKNFKLKTLIYMILHVLIEIIIFYIINKWATLEIRKQNLYKDDTIFFNRDN